MADSSSSNDNSTSGSDLSDFEGALGEHTMEDEGVPFASIQPWRFEPPGRVAATQEREDDVLHAVVVTKMVKNRECLETFDVQVAATFRVEL